MIALVAAQLGVTSAVATTVVNVVLKAGTLVTVLGILGSIASGGAGTLMTMGWTAFKATVKRLAKKSMARAIAW
ncbi:circular bacteriocin, circularin A/uberolysin family [Lachnobacterium bovis]|uniref:Circular bacteriocin, circularin A/uberolysin family n=1 Tax=Lachnobacterium bovis DSM 14045 TaxID=1122142 RepID=A0A1H3G9M2_9FIRM|nr:circular bacteriocin, circularin A/uberolysin family [Lachnobacterium bovis]SDX99976.1 circular bacteriocin, circularin A/uberolysin family [Lachnobacterium bovis DSM 14045]